MWNVLGIMALVLSTSNVVHAEEEKLTTQKEFLKKLSAITDAQAVLVYEYVDNNNHDMTELDKTALENMKFFKTFKDSWKSECKKSPDEEKETDKDCIELASILKKLEADVNRLQETVDYEKEQNSPDGLIETACQNTNILNNAAGVIAHEKQVGKVTGVVNALLLHQAGTAAIDAASKRDATIKKYKKETGKTFSFKTMCLH